MQINDFVAQVKNEIEAAKLKHKMESAKKDIFYIENQRASAALENLLKRKALSKVETDSTSLIAFSHLLASRWDMIEDTDAVFANSLANQQYDILADHCQQAFGVQKNKLLRHQLKLENTDDVNLNRAVPSDNNETYIDVLECLRKAKYNGGELYHTHLHANLTQDYLDFLPADKNNVPLSNNEKDRVIHFNLAANKFYQSIVGHDKSKQGQRENSLVKSFGSKPITASYGQDGYNRLALRLFQNTGELIKSVKDFSCAERADLLDKMDLNTLNKIALNNSKDIQMDLPKYITKKSSYNGNEQHNYTMMMIYHAIYAKNLAQRKEEYNPSFFGYNASFFKWNRIPKTIKVLTSNIIADLMRESVALAELHAKAEERINKHPNMSPATKNLCLKALQQGTTGQFIKQADALSHPKPVEQVSKAPKRS